MSTTRPSKIAIVFVTAIATAAIVGTVSRPGTAGAQATRVAVCLEVRNPSQLQPWMNQQLAAGKGNFVGVATAICAW
jgi:hypothetical protein